MAEQLLYPRKPERRRKSGLWGLSPRQSDTGDSAPVSRQLRQIHGAADFSRQGQYRTSAGLRLASCARYFEIAASRCMRESRIKCEMRAFRLTGGISCAFESFLDIRRATLGFVSGEPLLMARGTYSPQIPAVARSMLRMGDRHMRGPELHSVRLQSEPVLEILRLEASVARVKPLCLTLRQNELRTDLARPGGDAANLNPASQRRPVNRAIPQTVRLLILEVP